MTLTDEERRQRDVTALEREIFRARLFGFKDLERLYSDALAAIATPEEISRNAIVAIER